jgi:ATP/maltotriose-dependent transcriptional regulator MalT/two-component SAPR family response regulator
MVLTPNVKLLPPRRQPQTLRRVRLLDVLHNNIHRKVLFVCAPAGYGKTTLLVDFAEDIDAFIYWYRIAPEDNSLVAFYENVIQAFQLHHPEFGNELSLSLEEGLPSPNELAYRLVNQLEETLQDFSIVVLDDYHLVSTDPEIADFLEAFITYLPDHLRLLIGSRNVYGIPTALLYVQEQLAIISEEELKFRQEEVMELCWKYYHIQLTEEQCNLILKQAEGWIVAILLALRSENLSIEIPKILGAREHVYTYLAEEVIQSLPPELIDFLYATSLVDEFTVPLANHVLGIKNAQQVIKQLDELNLFLSSSSESRSEITYRYHQLFSDFLRGSLQTNQPERLPELHHRIASWYEQQQQFVRAITHYFLAEEDHHAVSLVDQVSRDLYLSGQVRILEQWYETLSRSDHLLRGAPDLLLNLAKFKINLGEFDQAEELLFTAEETFLDRADYANHVNLLVTRGMLLRFTNRIQEAYDLAIDVQTEVETHELDRYYWYQAERLKGMGAYFLGRKSEAISSLKRAGRALREMLEVEFQPRQAHELIMTLTDIGYIAIAAGDIFEAQVSYREALDLARRVRTNFNDLTTAHNNYAYLHFLMGNYGEAWRHYLQAFEVAKYNNLNRYTAYIYNGQADVLREIGEWKQAEVIYQNARQQAEKLTEKPALADAFAGLVAVETFKQDFNTAMYFLREMARIQNVEITSPAFQLRFGKLYQAMGQFKLARKTYREALTAWESDLNHSPTPDLVELYLHLTLLHIELKEEDEALSSLEIALEQAALLGYDQFVVNLVRQHLDQFQPVLEQLTSPYASGLLERAHAQLPTLEELVLEPPEEDESDIVLNVSGLDDGTIRLNGAILPHRAWSSVGARALFYFILDKKKVTKEEIALAFWPDFSQAKINSNFHATLWRVRKALGSKNIIVFIDGHYQFAPDAQIYYDVEEVETLLKQIGRTDSPVERRTAMRRVAELYQSDFIQDIDMAWADERRFELQNRFRRVLSELAEDYFDKRNFTTALEIFQRALVFDPYQDSFHLRVMQCLNAIGDPVGARRHYKQYAALLKKELGITPESELSDYLATLKE